ncbi:MAG: hypothetical protein JOZ46_09065 [Candidatus Dormibacteraeota bacterium]|nr:hypothetical protein [Candidatus Dormibacteraeota bacterium]
METTGRHRPVTELVFLGSGPVAVRALVVVLAAVGAGVAGNLLYRYQADLAARLGAGQGLSGPATFVAHGSGAQTAWVGWVAALFFLIAAIRVRRSPPEPSPGVTSPERLTPAQLRAGLRREYAIVRALLVLVALAAAVDVARAFTLLAATGAHAGTLLATLVEAAGLVAATLTLLLWAWWFGADVRRLGAL